MNPDFSSSARIELSMNCSGLAVFAAGCFAKFKTFCTAAVETYGTRSQTFTNVW